MQVIELEGLVEAGAGAVSVTVNGLGERAGNGALDEVLMALKVACGHECAIDTPRMRDRHAWYRCA